MLFDNIPIDKIGKAFVDLAQYQWENYGEILQRPPGMLGEDTMPLPPVINAPDYEELEEIKLEKFMRQRPHHPKRVK
uniref:Uncharacterized protein n=1 Tax=viral metagenome TaxID=1070528 RepID=A0A6M3L775_9ZZZZ